MGWPAGVGHRGGAAVAARRQPLKKSPQGRGRRGPALEQATYEVSFPTRPLSSPLGTSEARVPTRKVVAIPRTPVATALLVQAFSRCATKSFPSLAPLYTPKVATSLRRRPLGSEVEEVIIGCKDHQHYNYSEPNPKSHLLSTVRQRFSPHRFDCVVQQVTAIEQRHGEQIEQTD